MVTRFGQQWHLRAASVRSAAQASIVSVPLYNRYRCAATALTKYVTNSFHHSSHPVTVTQTRATKIELSLSAEQIMHCYTLQHGVILLFKIEH